MPMVSAICCRPYTDSPVCKNMQGVFYSLMIFFQTASDGRPDGAHLRLVLPQRNWVAQRFTIAYDRITARYRILLKSDITCYAR